MRVELSWTLTASELRGSYCCVCEKDFTRQVIEARLISDGRLMLGEICPTCIRLGERYVQSRMRRNLSWRMFSCEMQLMEDRKVLPESVRCPSVGEYEAFVASVDGPRYATQEEADAAYERGEW